MKNMVDKHHTIIGELQAYNEANERHEKKQDARLDDLESGFDFLKKMGASSGGDMSGLLEEIAKMKEALRNEFGEKLADARRSLSAKIDMTEEELQKKIDAIEKQGNKTDNIMNKHVKENSLIINNHTDLFEEHKLILTALKSDRVL